MLYLLHRQVWNSLITLFILLLVSCGGGGGSDDGGDGGDGNGSGITEFSGGTVEDLKALNPDLTFEQLNITGTLVLPARSSTQIAADSLTITATGAINVPGGTCVGRDPSGDLDLIVAGNVVFEAGVFINLGGRPACSCFGADGGSLTIDADSIEASLVTINTSGGGGVSDVGLGCDGGNAGQISMNATDIVLNESTLQSRGGQGGSGSLSDGADGMPSSIDLNTVNKLSIHGGRIDVSDGALNLTAAETSIFAELDFNQINEMINGQTDTTAPIITVQSPANGSQIDANIALDVVFQIQDQGVGVREGMLTGLGVTDVPFDTQANDLNVDFATGLVTVTIDQPLPGSNNSISIAASDNKNNSALATIDNLTFSGPFPPTQLTESEPNNNFSEAQFAFVNATIAGSITHGDVGALSINGSDIEDLYRIEGESVARNFSVTLNATGTPIASFDIDLHVIIDNGVSLPSFIASSTSPGTTETINNLTINPGEVLYIGVSQLSPTLFPESLGLRGYSLAISAN